MSGAVSELIRGTFGEDRLRGFRMARGRIVAFVIDLHRCLNNTPALPREFVMLIVEFSYLLMTNYHH